MNDFMLESSVLEIPISDLQNFIIDSERYALGRISYYPTVAIKTIRKYRRFLTAKTKSTLINDIETWLQEAHYYPGLEYCEEWEKLLKELKETK